MIQPDDSDLAEQPPDDGWFPAPIPVPDADEPEFVVAPRSADDDFAAFDEEARRHAEALQVVDVPISGDVGAGVPTPAWLHLSAPTPHVLHGLATDTTAGDAPVRNLLPSDPMPKPATAGEVSIGEPVVDPALADVPSWIDADTHDAEMIDDAVGEEAVGEAAMSPELDVVIADPNATETTDEPPLLTPLVGSPTDVEPGGFPPGGAAPGAEADVLGSENLDELSFGPPSLDGVQTIVAPPTPAPLMPEGLDPVPIVPAVPAVAPTSIDTDAGLRLGGAAAAPSGPSTAPIPPIEQKGSPAPATTVMPPVAPSPTGPIYGDAHAPIVEVPKAWFSRVLTWLIPLLLVASAGAAYLLARQGADEFLDSNGGKVEAAVTDPRAPGYAALVEPTPSMLMVWVDGLGNFSGASILSLAEDDIGGSILILPPFTQLRPGDNTLYADFEAGGSNAVEAALSRHLNLAFGEVETIDGDRWEDLLGPVDPLPIEVTDPLITRNDFGEVGVRFESGDSSIAAEDIVDFLGWRNPDEVQLNQQFRHAQFWDVWITEVASGADDVLPGESDAGVGRFVRGLANGLVDINRVEFTERTASAVDPIDGTQTDAAIPAAAIEVIPDDDQLKATILEMIPFPVAPFPGDRPRVRLLDGVDSPAGTLAAARVLVGRGAQVAILGNADRFDVEETRIVFHGVGSEADALDFADALATTNIEGDFAPTPAASAIEPDAETSDEEEAPELQRTIEVTVVLGRDVMEELGL